MGAGKVKEGGGIKIFKTYAKREMHYRKGGKTKFSLSRRKGLFFS